jgi:hypothetical protein
MRELSNVQILEYYDVPQILTADDATGTHYLCTLVKTSENKGFEYIGVQISYSRLTEFKAGKLDLREAYLHPEVENAVYLVVAKEDTMRAEKSLSANEITEDVLPEAGYFYESSSPECNDSDIYELKVPKIDRLTFSTLANRMGWHVASRK